MKTIQQILHIKGNDVISIEPDASILDAVRLMMEKNIGALLVMDNDSLVGLLSERDYVWQMGIDDQCSTTTLVKDIMTPVGELFCATPEQGVDACMSVVTEKRVRHLPVVENNRVLGIISIGDLVKAIIAEQQFVISQMEHYIAGDFPPLLRQAV